MWLEEQMDIKEHAVVIDGHLTVSDMFKLCWLWHRSWLRHYSTSRKVAGSIPDEINGFFNLPNPSSRTVSLCRLSLTEISTRNLPGG
jgi:hypothetical protein